MSAQKYHPSRRLIVIVGPTGSGKSSLSLELADHFGCPIISTDSRQFYRGIPIGTAQPTAEDLRHAEHHFIACRDLNEEYNAGLYEVDALKCLDKLFENHECVIAVGGSGLYINALCDGLDDLPDVSTDIRETVRREYQEEGLEPLLNELKQLDEEYYDIVDKNNSARVMRAIEICRASGAKYSDLRRGKSGKRPFKTIKVGIDLPREKLYERINQRVDIMMADGLEAEAQSVYPLRRLNSLQTVGYRELFSYFDGEYDLNRAIDLIKRNSRRYAKRQMTWFRRDPSIQWFNELQADNVIKYIEKYP